MRWVESKQGYDVSMPCSFDVLHPGAEQVVLVAFEVGSLVKMGAWSDMQNCF